MFKYRGYNDYSFPVLKRAEWTKFISLKLSIKIYTKKKKKEISNQKYMDFFFTNKYFMVKNIIIIEIFTPI